jgi:hypothetical protein
VATAQLGWDRVTAARPADLPKGGGWFAGVAITDVVAGVALSVAAVLLVTGVVTTGHQHGGLLAGIAVVPMVLPVVWARRAPVPAAAVIAAATVMNWLLVGSLVRCGVALPAAFWVAFMLGLVCGLRAGVWGLVVVFAGLAAETVSDPAISPALLVVLLPVSTGFFLAGRVCREREAAIASLAARNTELAAQRERTASVAVRADRARIEDGLAELIGRRIARIAAAADETRERLPGAPETTRAALTRIADEGRDTLTRMRDVVGALRDDLPTAPQPGLADLPALMAEVSGGGQLRVAEPCPNTDRGTQLAVYRIVEHLLRDVARPGAEVQIRVAADRLTVRVSAGARADVAAGAVGAARQWVALYGGTMHAMTRGDHTSWVVSMPVVAIGV